MRVEQHVDGAAESGVMPRSKVLPYGRQPLHFFKKWKEIARCTYFKIKRCECVVSSRPHGRRR